MIDAVVSHHIEGILRERVMASEPAKAGFTVGLSERDPNLLLWWFNVHSVKAVSDTGIDLRSWCLLYISLYL